MAVEDEHWQLIRSGLTTGPVNRKRDSGVRTERGGQPSLRVCRNPCASCGPFSAALDIRGGKPRVGMPGRGSDETVRNLGSLETSASRLGPRVSEGVEPGWYGTPAGE